MGESKYKKIVDLELEDEGFYNGDKYKITEINRYFPTMEILLTISNDKITIERLPANQFEVINEGYYNLKTLY